MIEWWAEFSSKWNWGDPITLLTLLTVVVTALIPLFIWRFGVKQASRDSYLREQQAGSLDRQEKNAHRQRRDTLLTIIDQSVDETHLRLLWGEVQEFVGPDGQLLKSVYRANVSVALPGANVGGIKVSDKLDDNAVTDYVTGLHRRYSSGERGFHPYSGLLGFLRLAQDSKCAIPISSIVELVTGVSTEVQRPGHQFYRELVNLMPEAAGSLLGCLENIDYRNSGGTRLNVLTGVLLGIKDYELDRVHGTRESQDRGVHTLKNSVPGPLATLLDRHNLNSLDRWSIEGSTEKVSATVAWLIRAIGWLSDVDDHMAMRMVQNLQSAVSSIPAVDHGWGIDRVDVEEGFLAIEEKQPELWAIYGQELESAATAIGPWRKNDPSNDVPLSASQSKK